MKEKVRQLASGVVDTNVPKIELLQSNVEEIIAWGQNYRGDIRLFSANQLAFRGLIYSDDSRVVLLQNSFAGLNAFIPYEVRAELLDPGTVLSGNFCLVYNGGEMKLPYRFEVRRAAPAPGHPAETLGELAQLAHLRWKDAQELFDSREFARLPLMEDRSVRAVCDGLRRALSHRNSLEEFLVGTGAKERVSLAVDETSRSYVVQDKTMTDTIRIQKNTWGHFRVTVTSDNPCVTPERDVITQDDFEGDSCDLTFTIRRNSLHGGKNYARILLTTPLQKFHVDLTLTTRQEPSRSSRRRWERRSEQLEFQKTWLNFLASKGDPKESLEYLQYCWEEMTGDEEPSVREKLYRVAISLGLGDVDLAQMILEDVQMEAEAGRRQDTDAYCAYLYLQVQITESWEKKEQLLKILHHYQDEGRETVFLFLLMLTMDEGAVDRPMEILDKMRGYYRSGCRSPFLYLEACRIYNRHPDILKRLDDFELHTLIFGAKHGTLTEETALYLASLASREHSFRPALYRLLSRLYETYKRDEILGAICAILIRGDCRQEEFFVWFSRGVVRDIRLTRLYDYYLYTVPDNWNQPFPREIVLYFSYNSPRTPESQQVLYLNLLRFYEKDAQIMESYEGQIRDFLRRSVAAGKIDEKLAFLYNRRLSRDNVDDKTARILPDLLRACEICCGAETMTEAILVYGELEEELTVPLKGGRACIPIYSSSCRILFADASGSRYAGIPMEQRKLLNDTQEMEKRCYELCPRHAMLRLAECVQIVEKEKKTENEIRLLKRELDVRDIHRQFRQAMVSAIVEYAIAREKPEEEEILTCLHYNGITPDQRLRLTKILIDLGQLAEADLQVRRVGYRDLPAESLRRLVSMTIQNNLYEKDDLLVDMCHTLFEMGEADDNILKYLCTYYNSSSAEMMPILRTAYGRKLRTGDMAERLLAQMLFTGADEEIDEVFSICLEQGGMDRLLLYAYLVVKCHGYFLEHRRTDETVFRFVERMLSSDAERAKVPEICVLALTKFYAGEQELTKSERELCSDLVDSLYRKGRIFAWMKKLAPQIRLPEEIRCRTWVEYQGKPDMNLELRCRILPEMEEKPELRLSMPQVYPGIYVKSVLLYEGDEMIYEIVREGEEILERGNERGPVSPEEDGSRFGRLNRLQARMRENRDPELWQQEILDYGMMETWTGQIFDLPPEE